MSEIGDVLSDPDMVLTETELLDELREALCDDELPTIWQVRRVVDEMFDMDLLEPVDRGGGRRPAVKRVDERMR